MVATLPAVETNLSHVPLLLRPDRLPNGQDPETRVTYGGISWERFVEIDESRGSDNSSPRLIFLNGNVEIMTTSNEHERIKKWFGDLMALFFRTKRMAVFPRGQATIKSDSPYAQAEPDEAWCIEEEKIYPDIVFEVALTSGGIGKLELYKIFQIREVWIWRKHALEIHTIGPTGEYSRVIMSGLVPNLPIQQLREAMAEVNWMAAMDRFEAAIRKL